MAIPTEVFLATMFSGTGHASRTSGLLIAASTDGITFRNISKNSQPIFTPPDGMRDPMLLFWRGEWHLVYSYGPNLAPLLFLAKSSDLLHWIPVGSLRLTADQSVGDGGSIHNPGSPNHFIDVPQWIVDPAGNVHLIACIDVDHHWVELHPLSSDPTTWSDQANWSNVSTMTDLDGRPLVQGNSFVAQRNGTYFMAFNGMDSTTYFLRTSRDLVSRWSAPQALNLDRSVEKGDSENLVCLANGALRFYISNGNSLTNVMWCVDSENAGADWSSPKVVNFEGFGGEKINWAQFVRVTDPAAISSMVSAKQLP
jgi:hypothetical protein